MKPPFTPSILAIALSACGAELVGPSQTAEVPSRPLPPTTDGAIALQNLDFRIETAERLLAASASPGIHAELISLLSQRARFRGSFEDYDRADQESERLLALADENKEALLSRAGVLGGLHRFDEAHALLSQIEGAEDVVLAVRLPMWTATGREGSMVELARARTDRTPSFAAFVALGSALAADGEFEAADEAFLDAADAYRDVSPFAIAWLQFQRGVMWSERAGFTERGRALYEDAVARLPAYVTANVHLAELERTDDPERAIERLRTIVDDTRDPEPLGLLGELLLEVGRMDEGKRLVDAARSGYEDLLQRHRAAFADHAAEFHLGPGHDVELAFELARDNLDLRPTERAYALAIRAALASGHGFEACTWAREAEWRERTGIELTDVLLDGITACTR